MLRTSAHNLLHCWSVLGQAFNVQAILKPPKLMPAGRPFTMIKNEDSKEVKSTCFLSPPEKERERSRETRDFKLW